MPHNILNWIKSIYNIELRITGWDFGMDSDIIKFVDTYLTEEQRREVAMNNLSRDGDKSSQ